MSETDHGNGSQMRVPSATSGIVVSNPAHKRIPAHSNDSKPDIKIVVTEQKAPETVSNIRLLVRKPRKEDLTKVINKFTKTRSTEYKPQERFLILGGSSPDRDVSSLISDSFNIPKFVDDTGSEIGVTFVKCPECGKKLKQRSYRSHLRTHLGEKQFKCDLCNDTFTRKNDVKRHKKLIHEKPRDHQCHKCEKYFLTQENLRTHELTHLSELRCRECGHGFGKLKYYEDHIKFVHPAGRGYLAKSEEAGEDEESIDSPPEPGDREPAILRRPEKRHSEIDVNVPIHDVKKSKLTVLANTPSILVDTKEVGSPEEESETVLGPRPSDTSPPGLGQLVEMPDGTFVIVNGDTDETAGSEEEEQGESQVRHHLMVTRLF